ncbi:MAG: prolyl oligopeptidase family serine peptidase [Opitutaceae bacterium]
MKCALFLLSLLVLTTLTSAAGLVQREWTVDGVKREALVYIPDGVGQGGARPVVLVFHGHGGTSRLAARGCPIHEHWPEAIVVYPQGLPTPSPLVDHEGTRNGWQSRAGMQGDRDLRFIDVMLASLRAEYPVDDKRIYATGHSNGGLFTYLLWAERGDTFAAFAPSAALLGHGYNKFKPKPILHLASPQDPLVKFSAQERMLDYVLKLDGCGPLRPNAMGYTAYPSSQGTDVAVYLHSGGHRYAPAGAELIVKFFKAHPQL